MIYRSLYRNINIYICTCKLCNKEFQEAPNYDQIIASSSPSEIPRKWTFPAFKTLALNRRKSLFDLSWITGSPKHRVRHAPRARVLPLAREEIFFFAPRSFSRTFSAHQNRMYAAVVYLLPLFGLLLLLASGKDRRVKRQTSGVDNSSKTRLSRLCFVETESLSGVQLCVLEKRAVILRK